MMDLTTLKQTIQKDYMRKVNAFRLLPLTGQDILVGDSMIAFMLMRKYGFESWLNMGIAGDTTVGVIERLDAVIRQKPKRVILSIGSNDLVLTEGTHQEIVKRIKTIVTILKSHLIDVYYLLITPVCHQCPNANELYIARRTNDDILILNQLIQKTMTDASIIDTYTPMIDHNHSLQVNYSKDGIHLNEFGYRVFTKTIHEALR